MKARITTAILILIGLFVAANKSYAWPLRPVADVKADPEHVLVNGSVTLDGSGSYDPDGGSITEYCWDFTNNGSYDKCDSNSSTTTTYANSETYTVKLRVKDDEDQTDTVTCLVYVYEDKTLRVDENTSCTSECDGSTWEKAFKHLQDALAVVQPTNKIWVAQGTYYPDVNSNNAPGGSDLREETFQLIHYVQIYGGFPTGLTGEGSSDDRDPKAFETILSGDLQDDDGPDFTNRDDNSYHVVTGADNAILDGFTITGGYANNGSWGRGGGIYCDGVSLTVSNCVIRDNWVNYVGGGMCNYNGSSPTVTNCFFIDNKGGAGGGMGNDQDSHPTLTNCVFSGNYATYDGGGIRNISLSSVTLINCTFSKNHAESTGGGLEDGSAYSPVTNCIFWGNTASHGSVQAQQIRGSPVVNYSCIEGWDDTLGGTGNFGYNPEFVAPAEPAGPDGICGTLDDGLRLKYNSPCVDAADGDVAPSTDILGYGRIDIEDVVDTGTGDPPCADMGAYEMFGERVVYNKTQDKYYLSIQTAINEANSGDEIWVGKGTYTLTSQISVNKAVHIYGGFDGTETQRSQRDWRNNVTKIDGDNNVRCFNVTADATVDGFTITNGNASNGGGIYCSGAGPTITNCTITDNTAYSADYGGGAMFCYSSSHPDLKNCLFSNNEATNGHGGAILFHTSAQTIDIENCTFSRNSANNGYAGAIYSYYSGPYVVNSILWDNSDSTVNDWDVVVEGQSFGIYYSDFSGIYIISGTFDYANCIHIDPQFADPVNGDFHLKSKDGRWDPSTESWVTTDTVYSKCLVHAHPSYSYSNEPTPNGSKRNMGAYGNTSEASKMQSSNLGSLNVSVWITDPYTPAAPANAQWKLSYEQDGTWHSPYNIGGYTMEGLVPASDYYVVFKDVSGYTTPSPVGPFEIEEGELQAAGGGYTPE